MLRTISVVAVAASAMVAAPSMAHADQTGARSVRVSRAGLDLNDPTDAAKMLSRLHHAAHSVCEEHGVRALAELQLQRACIHDALDRAVASLDTPTLTALYEGRPIETGGTQLSALR